MNKDLRTAKYYLVAGGAGFVGSNLVAYLLKQGAHVDVVDDISTGRYENIQKFERHKSFRFFLRDISDADLGQQLTAPYDAVFHLACPTGVPNIAIMGEQMLRSCSQGTFNLLSIATRCNAKFLYASSAEAYGDPEVFPQIETYVGNVDPIGPRSPYEEGKRFGEALTRYWGHKYGVKTNIVRIFNCYGQNMSISDQRVIPQMIGSMMAQRPVVIFGDGEQTRTFIHVDDLIQALLRVVDKGGAGEVYNIGGTKELTVNELLEAICQATGMTARPQYKRHFIADHRGRRPDTSKIEALGWRASVSMAQGLRSYFETLRDHQRSPRAEARRARPGGTVREIDRAIPAE